jgi:hypothetical protein
MRYQNDRRFKVYETYKMGMLNNIWGREVRPYIEGCADDTG